MRTLTGFIFISILLIGFAASSIAQYINIVTCKRELELEDTIFLINPYNANTKFRSRVDIPAGTTIGIPFNTSIPENEVVGTDVVLRYATNNCPLISMEAYQRIVLPAVKELYVFLKKNIIYPSGLNHRKRPEFVVIGFDIRAGGTAGNIEVFRSAHPLLDKEAIRLVSGIPAENWVIPQPREYKNMLTWGTYHCRMLIKF